MLKRAARSLIHLLAGLAAGLVILASLAAWALSEGPVSLGFLNRHIEDGLNSIHSKFRFQLDDTVLAWAGWERTLDVRILNVHIIDDKDEELAYVPELSVALNGQALFSGVIAPKRIELFGPSLVLARQANGAFEVGFEGGGDDGALLLKGMVGQLATQPQRSSAMSYLQRVDIVDARVRLEDQVSGRTWRAPAADVAIWREGSRVRGQLGFDIESDGLKATVKADGSYMALGSVLEGHLSFTPVVPAMFAGLDDGVAGLAYLDVPLAGDVSLSARRKGGRWALDDLNFKVHGKAGKVTLPDPMAQTVQVETVDLQGRYDGEKQHVAMESAAVVLAKGSTFRIPASLNGGVAHDLPMSSVTMKGGFSSVDGVFELESLQADLNGVEVQASGHGMGLRTNGDFSGMDMSFDASLKNLPADKFAVYWPQGWGRDAREWAVPHLSAGAVSMAKIKARVQGANEGLGITAIVGAMKLDGMTVDYLSPLPPVTGASGDVFFTTQAMDIVVKSGAAGPLALRGGKIRFTGLDEIDQYANVILTVDGAVSDALTFVDSEPLGFASAVGIDPAMSKGEAATTLNLKFMLAKDLSLDQVEVSATSLLRDVALPKVLFGLDLSGGVLNLQVDKAGMDVTGAVTLGPMPAEFAWRRNFKEGHPIRSHYRVRGQAKGVRDTRDLGFDLAPFPNEFIQGDVGVDVEYVELNDGKAELKANLSLKDARLLLPDISWRKEVGVPGKARTHVLFDGGRISGIPDFSVEAGDMRIAGVARYAKDGTGLQRVDVDRVKFARNDFAGSLIALDSGGWQIVAHGKSLDFAPILERLSKKGTEDGELEQQAADLSLSVTADLERVWMADNRFMENVHGTVSRSNDAWQSIRLTAEAGNAKDLKVVLESQGEGQRLLSVTTSDAGAVLSAFGVYENMRGGSMTLAGGFDDTKPGQPFAGKLQVTDYNIVNAPTIAHLVSVMALTGIVDALKGEGLSFQVLDVPMAWREGVLSLKDAKASGLSLGLTASGNVYWDAEVIAIEGTLVPAYALNSVFGKIPLLGGLLTGGEEGSGVFAATYAVQGALEKPKVTVNPLSALAPGFLRNLFDIFTPDVEAPKPEAGPPTAPTAPEVVPEKEESL